MSKDAPQAYKTAIARQARRTVELYEVRLLDGTIYYLANAQVALACGGRTWEPFPVIRRDPAKTTSELRIDNVTVEFQNAELDVDGTPTRLGVLVGQRALLGAEVLIWRADRDDLTGGLYFHSDWTIEDAEITALSIRLELQSWLARLAKPSPARQWQRACNWILYSKYCGVPRAAHEVTGTATGGTTTSMTTGLAQADGHFDLGEVVFTSGLLAGQRRTVFRYTGGTFSFALPLAAAVANGTAFVAVPGCDLRYSTCKTKFANQKNFGGQPEIPNQEDVFPG